MLVGPMTLALIPVAVLLAGTVALKERRALAQAGLRRHLVTPAGFAFYLLLYQFPISPISLLGYALESVHAPRQW
jgi:hypothetical protein